MTLRALWRLTRSGSLVVRLDLNELIRSSATADRASAALKAALADVASSAVEGVEVRADEEKPFPRSELSLATLLSRVFERPKYALDVSAAALDVSCGQVPSAQLANTKKIAHSAESRQLHQRKLI